MAILDYKMFKQVNFQYSLSKKETVVSYNQTTDFFNKVKQTA